MITRKTGFDKYLAQRMKAPAFAKEYREERAELDAIVRRERNEYHGITVDRASRILDALRVHLKSALEQPVLPPRGKGHGGQRAA